MKKLLLMLTVCLALAGCATAETLELTGQEARDVETLVETIRASEAEQVVFDRTPIAPATLRILHDTFPDKTFEYSVSVLGEKVRSTAESFNLYPAVVQNQDTFDKFFAALEWLPNLTELRALDSIFTYDQMTAVKELRPQLHITCKLRIGKHNLRNNVTAFSTRHSETSTRYSSDDMRALKYMDNLLALDIGHNAVDDLSFLYDLPELRILILADNQVSDLTPIASLEHLEYLELFVNPLTDLSPLAGLENLIDLHIGFCEIEDFSPLVNLKKLDRLWMSDNPFTEEDIAMLREALPECNINTTAGEIAITAEGWRQGHPRYLQIVRIFERATYEPFKEIRKK